MWTSIIDLASNAFGAVKEWFGFQSKRLDLKNSPDMKKAAEAKAEASAVDRTRKAIATNNLDEIRKDLAE